MAAKKHTNKGAPRHMPIDEHAIARRTFGHGRMPPHPNQGNPSPPKKLPPDLAPGQAEFTGPEEQQMRHGMRKARGAPPTDGSGGGMMQDAAANGANAGPANDGDADDGFPVGDSGD